MRPRHSWSLPALAAMAGACGHAPTPVSTAIAPSAAGLFSHVIVDDSPPGGRTCCTDVLAAGDIDGDGHGDIVVGGENATGHGLVWYEYATWTRHGIDRGQFTTDGDLADLDGDGDLDIVVGDLDRGLRWYENHRHGTWWTAHAIAAGYVHDLAIGDLDGDGRPEVVTTDKQGLYLHRQVARRWRQHTLVEGPGEGLALADLDGDGDLDIAWSQRWLENDTGHPGGWRLHRLAAEWPVDTRIAIADIDGDNHLDVVLSVSEGDGGLAWFRRPTDPRQPWQAHPLTTGTLTGTHSLVVADFDLDGDADVVTAEMHTAPERRITLWRNDGEDWTALPLAGHGSHNMVAADLDRDGAIDLVGKNYAGTGRFVEFWHNRAAALRLTPAALGAGAATRLQGWTYRPLDTRRPEADRQRFGLVIADIDGDGDDDVTVGGSLYDNPGTDQVPWPRRPVAPGLDIIHVTAPWHDGWRRLIALGERHLVVLEATADGPWRPLRRLRIPPGRSQGWAHVPTADGRSSWLWFTRGNTLLRLGIPPPGGGRWTLQTIRHDIAEDGIAAGDLDGDGDMDVVAVAEGGRRLLWLEARGRRFVAHRLGASLRHFDRVAIADIDGDGRPDIAFTEETRDTDYNARVGWLQAPPTAGTGPWRAHTVMVLRSANSLAVADVDADGDIDLVVAEHTDLWPGHVAADNWTGLLVNGGNGLFTPLAIDIGPRSSHLGAQVPGKAGQTPAAVLSAGWHDDCCLHRWVATGGTEPRQAP